MANIIIAAFCIEHDVPLLFPDRDFQPFVEHLRLKDAPGACTNLKRSGIPG